MTLVLFLYIQLGKCGPSKLPSTNPTSSGEPSRPGVLLPCLEQSLPSAETSQEHQPRLYDSPLELGHPNPS